MINSIVRSSINLMRTLRMMLTSCYSAAFLVQKRDSTKSLLFLTNMSCVVLADCLPESSERVQLIINLLKVNNMMHQQCGNQQLYQITDTK